MKMRIALLIFLLVTVSMVIAQDAPSSRYEYAAPFTIEDCPPEAAGGLVEITCGTLAVPENRADPDSRTIQIAVAIAHTTNPDPQTPLAVLGGGPGSELIGLIFARPELGASLTAQRDVILIEQRGVGYSRPRLDCPNEAAILLADDSEAVRACFESLTADGADLTGYNSVEAAADVEALRIALGIEQWNLLGESYGTRWALTVARNYPDGVRSMVLDGVFPPQINFEVWMRAIPSVIDRLLAACAADTGCGSAYPDLAATLRQTITRLNETPLTVWGVSFNGDHLSDLIVKFLYDASLIPLVPALIDAASKGDTAYIQTQVPAEALQPNNAATDEPLHSGIAPYFSVQCNEEIAFADRAAFMGQVEDADPLVAAIARVNVFEFVACDEWQSGQAPTVENTPVTSAIPTLILNGEFDAATPMADGYLAAETLENATVLDFPGIGHTIIYTGECPLLLIEQFLTTLDGDALDTGCIAAEYGVPPFLLPAQDDSVPQAAAPTEALIAALQGQMNEEIAAHPTIPGQLLTVIAPTAGLDFDLAAGVVDVESGRALEPGASFRIASVTKTFIAAAVLRLFEMGQVDLDASIEQYVSAKSLSLLQSDGYATDRITLRQLLLHTSGITDFSTLNPAYFTAVLSNPLHVWTRTEQLQFSVDTTDPIGEPGAQYSYSDTGYILLGEIIERQTGENIGTAVRTLLGYDRLGLTNTYWEMLETAPKSSVPMAHQFFGDVDITTSLSPTVDLFGGGGLVSSPRDLALFFRALLRGEVFEQPTTLDIMLTIPETNIGVEEGMDAGMGIFRLSGGGITCWNHAGFWGVFAMVCPDLDVAIGRSINQSNQQDVSLLSVINPVLIHILDNSGG